MTPEEKELLIKDLCERLPYGVRVVIEYTQQGVPCTEEGVFNGYSYEEILKDSKDTEIVSIKPYLRPMSSMTEEEKIEYCNLQDRFLCSGQYPVTDAYELFDWLNEHHFDYRGLIKKGLAFEASPGMYRTK